MPLGSCSLIVQEVLLSPTVIQYELKGLLAGSNYSVKVEGEKEGTFATVVSTEFTTGKSGLVEMFSRLITFGP